eukprot:6182588-Pleurochrysis_carterae.AAC.2
MRASPAVLNAELRSTCDTCVTSVRFTFSASPSTREPWIQYVWISAIVRQPAAVRSWNLATKLNIRWMESVRAHESKIARPSDPRLMVVAQRGSRSCGGERSHRSISLHEGASNTPVDALT